MPFITRKVNRPVSEERETALRARMGKAVELVPGKGEAYRLLALEPDGHLRLRGDDSQPWPASTPPSLATRGIMVVPSSRPKRPAPVGDVPGIPAGNVCIKAEDVPASFPCFVVANSAHLR